MCTNVVRVQVHQCVCTGDLCILHIPYTDVDCRNATQILMCHRRHSAYTSVAPSNHLLKLQLNFLQKSLSSTMCTYRKSFISSFLVIISQSEQVIRPKVHFHQVAIIILSTFTRIALAISPNSSQKLDDLAKQKLLLHSINIYITLFRPTVCILDDLCVCGQFSGLIDCIPLQMQAKQFGKRL